MNEQAKITELSEGILNWYPFDAGSKKIIVDRNMVHQVGTITDGYDYVILTSDIEKTEKPQEIIKILRSKLKRDGRMLIMMNNRLGLRYFCGDRDPYTGRNFDGIEDYRRAYARAEDGFNGRAYDKAQITKMLEGAGWEHFRFYSVLTDLNNPGLIYSEDFMPNEDLSNRIFPTYNYPDTVFLEEGMLYKQFIDNHMFHELANAYLIECSCNGTFCDIDHVTSSLERGKQNALFTVIYKNRTVQKRAVYEEGRKRIEELYENICTLRDNGIKTIDASMADGALEMPYMNAEVAQLYLKRLLRADKFLFLQEMDRFRELILHSSEIVKQDAGDGEGAVLKRGYLDMVPLNAFHVNDTYMFFDQEFCEENCPANVIIWRMIGTFYAGDIEVKNFMPIDEILERYDLKRNLSKWVKAEGDFLRKLRREEEFLKYHDLVRANKDVIHSNRQRLNYSSEQYQRLFVDIFDRLDSRKLILFGSGRFAHKFLTLYGKEYPVYAIIDNNSERWGQKLEEIEIQSPKLLQSLPAREYKVLICIKDYAFVMRQLDSMGVCDYSVFDSNKSYPRKPKPITENLRTDRTERKKYHIGYVAGVFDLFHVGHVNLLRRAKEMCDYLIVGVVSDEGVYRQKRKYPIISCEDRCEVLRACRYADEVQSLPSDYDGIRDAYRLFHFDCQFSGDDHGDSAEWQMHREYLKKNGADLVFFPYTEKVSSTKLREDLRTVK